MEGVSVSDTKTLQVRIHEGFMEIGRFGHVAVYSGLTDKQRNSFGTLLPTFGIDILSLL